ncbi:TRAP transporter small permease subunit [Rhizobium halophytocola]|uniref:TRAP transporter small permease protein n=1 Tax=Rhizobium halophytocola TaxID=735519 RepID=A0ABS4E679_9HYPH|nr:TRAP transporter small permease [Rhizobium halophytocola]MBP1853418.1 TRAP-type C4-dicarboxylate transport system permease small subunit [Rhizobium halophytocola]
MSYLLRFRALYGRLLFACGVAAGITTFLMMVLVVANVAGRYLFNAPIDGTLELTESMLTVLITLSFALTQYEGGHIQVVLLTKNFSPLWRQVASTLAMLLGFIFFAWCTYAVFQFAMKSYAFDEHEWGSIQFPLYPVKMVCAFGVLLITIQFAIDTVLTAAGVDLPGHDIDGVSPEEAI